MASKDEYYQKVIVTLQGEINELKNRVKELEARPVYTPQPPKENKPIDENNPGVRQLFTLLAEQCNIHLRNTMNEYIPLFIKGEDMEKSRLESDIKYVSKDTFLSYTKSVDSRLDEMDQKAGRHISILTVNRHIQKCDYDGKGCSKLDTFLHTFRMNNYTKWFIMFLIAFIVVMTISLMISENNHIKRENALLNRTIELIQ